MLSTAPAFEPARKVGEGFWPTKEELLIDYLKQMILGCHHLVCTIPVVDICEHEPWDLPHISAKNSKGSKWYLFCPRHSLKGGRAKRQTKHGFWKSTGKDLTIKDQISEKDIGKRKILVYHRGRTPYGVRTPWIIHEYSATLDLPNQGAFVLCKLKKNPDKKAKLANLLPNEKGEPSSEMGQMASDCGYQISDGNSSFNLPTPVSDEGCYLDGYSSTPTSYNEVDPCSILNFDIPRQVPYQNVLEDYSLANPNWTDWHMTSTNENNTSYTTTSAELVVKSQFEVPYFGYNQEGYNLSSIPESYIPKDTELMCVPDYGFGCSTFIPNQDLQTWSNNCAIDTPMQPEGGVPCLGLENLVTSDENIFDGLPPLCNSMDFHLYVKYEFQLCNSIKYTFRLCMMKKK